MKQSKTILAVIMSLLLCSCVSYNYVTFERLEAGDINYPESVRRVGVVNNMPHFNFVRMEEKSSKLPPLEGNGTVFADTLAYLLASADYFDHVLICDSMLQGMNTSFSEPYALSPQKADSLIEAMGVDVLFSLDRVKVELSEWYERNAWGSPEYKGVKAVVKPMMYAYIPGRDAPWFSISDADSLYYKWNMNLSQELLQKEASAHSAYMLMEHLLPSWNVMERTYYASGYMELRDANVYMMADNWGDAFYLWKQAYETKKGKKKMMAVFNMAVYYEAHDDTERSIECLEEALTLVKPGSYDEGMMRLYLAQLKNRLEKRKKLDVQMKRFE